MKYITISRNDFTAQLRDYGFLAVANLVTYKYNISQEQIESELTAEGHEISKECKWVKEGDVMGSFGNYLADGRKVEGDGWIAIVKPVGKPRESWQYPTPATSAIMVQSLKPAEETMADLTAKNIAVHRACEWIQYPPKKADTASYLPKSGRDKEQDEREAKQYHRASFWACLNGMANDLMRSGLCIADVKKALCAEYEIKSLSQLNAKEWATLAAHIRACSRDRKLFAEFVTKTEKFSQEVRVE